MATHSPQKTHKCTYCEKMFHRKDHLKNHLQTHDPNKEAFKCEECGKNYNTKLGYKRHLALHAATSGDLTCKVCLQTFESTGVLLEHLRTHAGKSSSGTKEKKHQCDHCDRCFYTRKDVRRHMVVHTGRKDFLCQYCAQRFGRKDHLTRHMKKSHSQELLKFEKIHFRYVSVLKITNRPI
ncbi:zinc finger protein PLAG1 isoform X2 [Rhincodon typus]|uniref:zinc finger protein PLAG1 isoform X2 n=1 Tax=Rhincodon typus TaxID=259920 RepID=UPI00202E5F90|nr:zinc finger protein PLAG1 isoform X2 [Rhincodon typus]